MYASKRVALIGALLSGSVFAISANGASYVSPLVGGGGGTSYTRNCGASAVLVGVQGRWGFWLDQLTPVCQSFASNGDLAKVFTQNRIGGSGGANAGEVRCPTGMVVWRLFVAWGTYIDNVSLHCVRWVAATKSTTSEGDVSQKMGKDAPWRDALTCPSSQVAKGLKGKAGMYVDSLSLVCNVWNQ